MVFLGGDGLDGSVGGEGSFLGGVGDATTGGEFLLPWFVGDRGGFRGLGLEGLVGVLGRAIALV